MAGAHNTLSLDEVLDALHQNYGIPGDGEQSDIDSNYTESDTEIADDVVVAVEDEQAGNLDDLHTIDVIDAEENDVVQPQLGKLSRFDFSKTEWSCQEGEATLAVQRGEFRQDVGPVTILPREATAVDFFHLLFTMNIVKSIVRETNRYAQQCLEQSEVEFQDVTEAEILAYLGLVIAMSLHPLHSTNDYWSSDWILGVPALARVMSRNRFQNITRFLHLNDNSAMPARGSPHFDKLFKVRPFLESIKANFLSQYRPHKQLSVDEAMIKFKGRSSLKQYMPKKPVKRGMKMWCRADGVNGYLCDFEIYTGKTNQGVQHNLGFTVVTNLCKQIFDKWHEVYFDNFFTSLELVETLFFNKTCSCGTLKSGRKNFPKEMFDKKANNKLKRGQSIFRFKGPTTAVTWMDNRVVNMVSTMAMPCLDATVPVKRRKKDGQQEDVQCPVMVSNYNQYMGGVDRSDQMKSYYGIRCRSKKWWPRIFFELLDRAIVNSYILELESLNHMNKRSSKDFRLELAKLLIGNFTSRKRPGRPSLQTPRRFVERHFPSQLPVNEKGKTKERRCFCCSSQGKAKKTSYFCAECDIGLCVAPCFRIYHTQQ